MQQLLYSTTQLVLQSFLASLSTCTRYHFLSRWYRQIQKVPSVTSSTVGGLLARAGQLPLHVFCFCKQP